MRLRVALCVALWVLAAPVFAQVNMAPLGPAIGLPGNPNTNAYSVPLPAGLAWDTTDYPIIPSLIYQSGLPSYASAGITPEALFDLFSTARSAPGATYYVAPTGGSDGNNCTATGTPCASIGHAVTLCNTAAVPCKINVLDTGTYYKGQGFTNFNSILPTVDVAFIAYGGSRAVVCQCDAFAAPSVDGTYTNTYSYSLTNVERVDDTSRRDQYGNYVEMTSVATAAIANVTPNSWALVAGTIYIHRFDGSAVLNTNTRVFRSTGGPSIYLNNATQTSLFVGGATAGDGFDVEGGSDGLKTNFNTYVATKKAIVVENASLKYAGGVVTTAGNAVSIHSFNGIAAFFNVRGDASAADAFNAHNDLTLTGGTAAVAFLTVNTSGANNGRGTNQSNNGWTIHEDVKGIDLGGYYVGNNGGTVRDINASEALIAGTFVVNDNGDLANGGIQPPTAVRADDTAQIWGYEVQQTMPAASYSYYATSSAAIYLKNTPQARQPFAGAGTIGTW